MLIGVCWRYAKDKEQAVEYMNVGFVRVLMNLKQYRKDIPFELWARRVMINSIINEYKKNKRWNEKISDVKEERFIDVQGDSDISEHQEELLDLIRQHSLKLPPMTLKVFNLYAIDGYMHNEIAELLGISEGTSAWHYSEAKRRIRQMLGLEKNQ